MKYKFLKRSIFIALFLILVRHGLAVVMRLIFHSPDLTAPDNLLYIRRVEGYSHWVFVAVLASVWVVLCLLDRKPNYRHLYVQIALVLGIFTIISYVLSIYLTLTTDEVTGHVPARFSWIAHIDVGWFIYNAFITGVIAIVMIAIISRLHPKTENARGNGVIPAMDITVPETPAESSRAVLPEKSVHPLAQGVILGGVSGLLFVITIFLLAFSKILILPVLLPLTIVALEFTSFEPFIPSLFNGHEQSFVNIMAILCLTSLGFIVSCIDSFKEAYDGKPVPLRLLLELSACAGGILGAIYGVVLFTVDPDSGHLFGSLIGWAFACVFLALFMTGIKRVIKIRYTPSLKEPFTRLQSALLVPAVLILVAMLTGQAMYLKERRDTYTFYKNMEKKEQQRDSVMQRQWGLACKDGNRRR